MNDRLPRIEKTRASNNKLILIVTLQAFLFLLIYVNNSMAGEGDLRIKLQFSADSSSKDGNHILVLGTILKINGRYFYHDPGFKGNKVIRASGNSCKTYNESYEGGWVGKITKCASVSGAANKIIVSLRENNIVTRGSKKYPTIKRGDWSLEDIKFRITLPSNIPSHGKLLRELKLTHGRKCRISIIRALTDGNSEERDNSKFYLDQSRYSCLVSAR